MSPVSPGRSSGRPGAALPARGRSRRRLRSVSSRFDTDTALSPLGNGKYAGRIDRGWWIMVGPNGGYVAAILLRALLLEIADAARAPRSLTIHYLRPPVEGPIEVHVTLDRVGR